MAEIIKEIPIEEILEAMDVVWIDAQQRLDSVEPERVLARMQGAVYGNSVHPFRDKLHIEGMKAAFEFVLTGHNGAVEYWLRSAESIRARKAQPSAPRGNQ